MGHTARSVPRTGRIICALALALGALAGSVPTVYGSDSTFSISMTLRGKVAPDVGFNLSVGGINYAPFCVSEAEQRSFAEENPGSDVLPLCRSGRTYTLKVTVGTGESVPYEIAIYWPSKARVLWSETLTGDGRDHRLSYTYLFDLPATDTVTSGARGWAVARPAAIALPGPLPILMVSGGLAWLIAGSLLKRRGTASAERGHDDLDG